VSKRVPFSNSNLELNEIAIHHTDTETALRTYFSADEPLSIERFFGSTVDELQEDLKARLVELNHNSSHTILAAIEASFRIDYLQRCYKRKRDPLSRDLREIYKQKENYTHLDEIFNAWRDHYNEFSKTISDLKGVYKYRHWLAHGRYWVPKMGRKDYDYYLIYELGELVFNSFPFEGIN